MSREDRPSMQRMNGSYRTTEIGRAIERRVQPAGEKE